MSKDSAFKTSANFVFGLDAEFEPVRTKVNKGFYALNTLVGCIEGFVDGQSNHNFNIAPYNPTIGLLTAGGIAVTQAITMGVGTLVSEIDEEKYSKGAAFTRGCILGVFKGIMAGCGSYLVNRGGYAIGYSLGLTKNLGLTLLD